MRAAPKGDGHSCPQQGRLDVPALRRPPEPGGSSRAISLKGRRLLRSQPIDAVSPLSHPPSRGGGIREHPSEIRRTGLPDVNGRAGRPEARHERRTPRPEPRLSDARRGERTDDSDPNTDKSRRRFRRRKARPLRRKRQRGDRLPPRWPHVSLKPRTALSVTDIWPIIYSGGRSRRPSKVGGIAEGNVRACELFKARPHQAVPPSCAQTPEASRPFMDGSNKRWEDRTMRPSHLGGIAEGMA